MRSTDPDASPIIQPESSSDFAPLSNRGKVGAYFHLGDYSHPLWFEEIALPKRFPDDPLRVASVDMVRLSLKFDFHSSDHEKDFQSWCNFFRMYTLADFCDDFQSNKPAKYKWVFSMLFDAWHVEVAQDGTEYRKRDRKEPSAVNITVGLGFNKPDGKADLRAGFVEFNPNKTAWHAYFLLKALESRYKVRFEVSRWDYALDVQIPRSEVLVTKDQRVYECHISDSITTYLGPRNAAGRVKVYDKTKEAKLLADWTRIEVTYDRPKVIDGACVLPKLDRWPMVGRVVGASVVADTDPTSVDKSLTPSFTALVLALSHIQSLGEDIQPFLQLLDQHRARPKVKAALVPEPIPFEPESWLWCASRAVMWEKPLSLAHFFGEVTGSVKEVSISGTS